MPRKIVGRKLGKMHYIHKSAISYLENSQKTALQAAIDLSEVTQWNLTKISKDLGTISLLQYDDFDRVLFPCLQHATIINLETSSIKTIDYTIRENPPVLHRKELMLAPDHKRYEEFAKITAFCEAEGLFKNASYIGTKLKWEQRLLQHGYQVKEQNIVPL